MGLVLYGGYYEKEKALSILSSMRFYNKELEPVLSAQEAARGKGILGLIKIEEEKMHEDYLVEKLLMVKSILGKSGNDAIDDYIQLTSPDETHFLQPIKKMLPDEWMAELIDELSIPMKKDEFYHYLDIYNIFQTHIPKIN